MFYVIFIMMDYLCGHVNYIAQMIELRRSRIQWQVYAGCDKTEAELFFPVGNSGPALKDAEQAKLICKSRCPVIGYCALYALEHGVEGIWGGMDENERKERYTRRYPESKAREIDEEVRANRPELFTDSFLPPVPPLFISIEVPDLIATANSNIGNRA
jgi:WhiB family redox-sensing transcriptional regulator